MSRHRRVAIVLAACLALGACGDDRADVSTAAPPAPPTARALTDPTGLTTPRALAGRMLAELAGRRGPDDEQYFADGWWHNADGRCWYCQLGPSVTAAALAARAPGTPDGRRGRRLALASFDALVARHQQPDGSFAPPLTGQEGNGIATMFAASDLATATLLLGPTLDPGTRRRWATAVRRATAFVTGEFGDYYVNGNINLGVALLAAMDARISPSPEATRRERRARRFALFPATPQAAGYGLRVDRAPKRRDGRDGSAWLAERGEGGLGYDPEYTMLQADLLARAVALLRRPEDVRLLNLLFNRLRPAIDERRGLLDTSAGTRHTARGRAVPFLSAVPSVLVTVGHRADLRRLVARQFPAVRRELLGSLTYSYDAMYRAVGTSVGTTLIADR
jgi:hypothetical protein